MNRLAKLAKDIADSGITKVFGIPGSGASLELIDQLEKHGVRFYLTHFEASAAIMAGTTGYLTGHAGVAICIKGPGLANMVPGLAFCQFENYPLVAISEAYAPDTPMTKAHKRIDHEKLTAAVVKGRRALAEQGPDFKKLALWAEEELPAPVLFELPNSVITNEEAIPINEIHVKGDIENLVSKSQRPVIVAGTLAVRKKWSKFLNKLHIPIFSTAAAKGVVDETLPHSAGVFTGAGLKLTPEKNILPSADLVIGIGLRPNEVLQAKPFNSPTVNITLSADSLAEKAFGFIATAGCEAGEKMFEILIEKKWGLEKLASCLKELRHHMLDTSFLPAHVFELLEQHFAHNVRIVMDTGNFCTIGEHMWHSRETSQCILSGQARYMGTALPVGTAASLHTPEIPTVVIAGDGGIGPFISEIKLAVQNHLPLLLILMSDGGFGSIRIRARKDGLTLKPLTIDNPSWVSVLAGFGVPGFRTKTLKEFRNRLEKWSPQSGPLFLEVPFAPDIYEQMVYDIR